MSEWGAYTEEVLDQFQQHICILDKDGEILFINKAWKVFAAENGASSNAFKGANYLRVANQADKEAKTFISEIKKILAGKIRHSEVHYPCHSPTEKRWFKATARPLKLKDKLYVLVIHENESDKFKSVAEKEQLNKKLNAEQQRLLQIFNEAPVSMAIVKGKDHVFQAANEAYYRLTNRTPDIIGKNVREVFPELEGHGYLEWLNKVYITGETFSGNEILFYFYPEGSDELEERYLNFVYQPYRNEEGAIEGIFYTGVDVTEQVVVRKKIEESESRLSSIFENSNYSTLLWKVESTGYYFEEINSNAIAFFGVDVSKNELIGMSAQSFFRKYLNLKISESKWIDRYDAVKSSKKIMSFNYEVEGANGSIITEESIIPIFDKEEVTHILVITRDITDLRKDQQLLVEASEKTSRFARELNRILEEERAHWAREIHDEFGQQLSGIKMSLATLSRINFEPEASQLIISDVVKSLEDATRALKSFSTQLRPGILDSLGISGAVEWLVDEFERKSGIKTNKRINENGISIDGDVSIAIFRVCQETLNNIHKHAKASLVEVVFQINEKEIILEITDNGIGMSRSKLNDPFSIQQQRNLHA